MIFVPDASRVHAYYRRALACFQSSVRQHFAILDQERVPKRYEGCSYSYS